MSRSSVEVDLAYLQALERDALKLQCLMDCGVDNWEGYEAAVDAYNQEADGDE